MRALARRCPVCGRGAVFATHFRMNRACPACHVIFWRDPGEFIGAMYLDYAVAVAAFLVSWFVLARIAELSQVTLLVAVAASAVASVLAFYPWSRCLWTVLVYVSGGIERPPMRAIRGGKR
jgi:uncharacterized protein (DUF983 family)